MTTETISAAIADHLRDRVQRAATLPESVPEGWSISPVSPTRLVRAFDALRLKQGMTLHAYVFRSGGNGNGVVWAMPEHVPPPPPEACPRLDGFLTPPKPADALDDLMDAIEGDGSPFSFLSASLLARELREFGARWHGISWGACRVIGQGPKRVSTPRGHRGEIAGEDMSGWTWLQPAPTIWPPRITLSDAGAEVTLHVIDPVGTETIRQLTDTFPPGRYTFTTTAMELASGSGGIIW